MILNRQLIDLLSNGAFHSGEMLGKKLGITRSAIWKQIKQLEKLDIDLEKVPNKGYRLTKALELLDTKKIKSYLSPMIKQKINKLEILNTIPSTNTYLLNQAHKTKKSGYIVLAEQQTLGKGRRNRTWYSPFGHNIYLSLLWNFNCDPAEISNLSLAIATMVLNTLKNYGIKTGLQLKWPNDVYCQGKKIAGILPEMIVSSNEYSQVVIGIGINVNLSKNAAEKINQPYIDIASVLNTKPERNKLAGLLIEELICSLLQYQKKGFEPFLKQWQEYDLLKDCEITIQQETQTITGIAKGINLRGELLLLTLNGETRSFLHGEIKTRL